MKRRLFTILSALFLLLFVVVRALAAVWASEKAVSGGKPSNSFVLCCALIAASTAVAAWAMWKLRFEVTTFVVWVPLNAPPDMIERCVQPYRKLSRAKIVVRFWTKGDCGGYATHE